MICPYKGIASYWSVNAGGRSFDDACWTYREPLVELYRPETKTRS